MPIQGASGEFLRHSNATVGPRQNHLLRALSDLDFDRLSPHLELVSMPLGQVLYESGTHLRHAYFPTNAIISMLYFMEDGASAETAMTGNEGIVGVSLFMGEQTTSSRATVQTTGSAYRLKSQILRDEFNRAGALQHLLLRYTQCLLSQMGQTAVCNRYHSIDQQLCRWLLSILDRLTSNQLNMTHEVIANLLGVRREGITDAAAKLQAVGIINYSRGHITVVDRYALEARACECYQVVKKEFSRLLPIAVAT